MDRKSKIWIAVMMALLIVAIIAIILFNNKLKDSSGTLSSAIQQLKVEQDAAAALRTELEKAQANEAEIETLQKRLDVARADAAASEERVTALEAQLATAQAEAQSAAKAALEAQADATAQTDADTQLVAELTAQLTAAQSDATASAERIKGLEEQLAAAQTYAKTSGEKAKAMEEQLAAAQADAKANGEKTKAVEEQLAAAQADAKASGEKVTEIRQQLADAQADIAARNARITALEAEVRDGDERLRTLEATVAASLANISAEGGLSQEDGASVLDTTQALLQEAETRFTSLTGDLQDKLNTIDALNAQIEAMSAQSDVDAEKLAALQVALNNATAEAERQSEALEDCRTTYQKQLAEVEAYHVFRTPAAGEAHSAITVYNLLDVAADGVNARCYYDNAVASSNPVVLSLQVNGETFYTSAPLPPGHSIDSVTLERPLPPGSYEGMAVTNVYDAQGNLQFSNRVPIKVNVAG